MQDGMARGEGVGREAFISSNHAYDEYHHAIVHCKTLYKYSLLSTIHAFPSEGRTTWVRRCCNLAWVSMRNVLPVPPGTYNYAQ
jgi:hypothetical protein